MVPQGPVRYLSSVRAADLIASHATVEKLVGDRHGVTAAFEVLFRPDELRFDDGVADVVLGVPARALERDARCRLLGSTVGIAGTTRTGTARSAHELILIDSRQPYEVAFARERSPAIDFVYLATGWMRDLAAEVGAVSRNGSSLRTDLRLVDHVVQEAARAYLAVAAQPIAGRLTLETARHMLGVVMLLRRAAGFRSAGTRSRALPLSSIRRIDEFIHAHLPEDFGLLPMARLARQSVHHFIRSFRLTTGRTPHQYVLRRRVERAAELLETTGLPIAAIAADTGFSSQTHLTYAFARVYGQPPGRYRRAMSQIPRLR